MSDARIERLLDERDLRRSAELYAEAADRRDKALWASIFAEDGLIEAPGIRLEGRASIVAALDAMARLYVATQHRVHNQVVSIDGNSARGETYATADHLSVAGDRRTLLTCCCCSVPRAGCSCTYRSSALVERRFEEADAEYQRSQTLAGSHFSSDLAALLRGLARPDADPQTLRESFESAYSRGRPAAAVAA